MSLIDRLFSRKSIRHFSRTVLALMAAGVFGVLTLMVNIWPAAAATGINQTINFQGRLLTNTGAVVADGTYNMRFKIYQDGTGCVGGGTSPCSGTLKWTETRQNSASQGVTVRNGYFSVALGSVTAFGSSVDWNQDTLWMSLDVAGTGTGGSPTYDGEMLPFKRLTTTPYALNSNQLGGLTSGQYVQLAQGIQTTALTSNPAIGINATSGSSNLVTLQSSGTDVFDITSTGNLQFGNNANKTLSVATAASGNNGNSLTVQGGSGNGTDKNGGDLVLQGGNSTGAGTPGSVIVKPQTNLVGAFKVTNAAGTTTVLSVDTTNGRVGVVNAAPSYPLDVTGDINTSTQYRVGGTVVCTSSGCTPSSGSGSYIQNSTTVQTNANLSVRSVATGSVTGVFQGASGQTADILQVQSWNGSIATNLLTVSSSGDTLVRNPSGSTTAFRVQDSGSVNVLRVDSTNHAVLLGAANSAGYLWLADGGASGFSLAIKATGLEASGASRTLLLDGSSWTAGHTYTLPNETGTLCTSASVCSGYAAASGSGSYIQNTTSVQSSSNFHISGAGVADGSLQAPTLDAPTAAALNIGASGTPTATVINLNQNTSVAAGKTLTVTSALTSLTGATTGDALNVSNSTSTGNIALFKDNATAVFTIANDGITTLQGTSTSTTAFQVKTPASGTNQNVFQVDTVNERVGIGVMPSVQAKLNVVTATTTGFLVYQGSNSQNTAEFTTGGQSAGTVTVANGSATITGSGTSFTSFFKTGDGIYVASAAPQIRTISTITSDTVMTATSNFTSGTSGLSYTLGLLGAGTVTTNGTTTLTGSSTAFTSLYKVGDSILVNGETPRTITAIASDTSLTVSSAFSTSAAGQAHMRAGLQTMVTKPTGLTGYGTYTPQAALHVVPPGVGQKGLVVQAGGGQTANLLEVQNSSGTALDSFDASGNLTVSGTYNTNTFTSSGLQFGAAGTATLQAAATRALTITGHAASTWSTDSGDLSLQAAANLNLGNGGGTTINIGTNNAAHTIGIGNTGATGAQAITIGGTGNTANTVLVQGGTGAAAISVQAAGTGGILLGTVNSNSITLGSTSSTDTITIGQSTASNTIAIGNGTTAAGNTQTINIGTSATSTGKAAITIGNTNAASSLVLQAGSGDLTLLTNSASASVTVQTNTNSTTAFQVMPSAGVTPVFLVDTAAGWVGVNTTSNPSGYALNVNGDINSNTAVRVGGVSVCTAACTPSAGSGNYIQNGTVVQTTANFNIRSVGTSSVTGVLQGASGQTADILQVQSWNGTSAANLFTVGSAGTLTVAGAQTRDITTAAASTATALTIQPGTSSGNSSNGPATTVKGGDASGTTSVTGGTLTLQGGSATGASGTRNGGNVAIEAGTGATANGSILIGATNDAVITLGKTTGVQTVTVGQSTASNTINIGNATTAAGNTQTINIGTSATSTGKAAITVGNTNAASSLLLQAGTGGLNLTTNGSTANVTVQSNGDSTAAFRVQNSSSTLLFVVDASTNLRVQVGNPTADSTGVLLVLDTKNTSGDPTGVDGAMYYNSNTKAFRCYVNGAWQTCGDMLVHSKLGIVGGDQLTAQTATFPESYTIPANACVSGRVYRLTARGYYSTGGGGRTLTMNLKLGTTTVASVGAFTMPSSASSLGWDLTADFQCYSGNPNASGPVGVIGNFMYVNVNTGGIGRTGGGFPNSNTTAGNLNFYTIDTTASQAITMNVAWGTAPSGDSITMTQFTVEALGP